MLKKDIKAFSKALLGFIVFFSLVIYGSIKFEKYQAYHYHVSLTENNRYYGEGSFEEFLKVYNYLKKKEVEWIVLGSYEIELGMSQYFLFETREDYNKYRDFIIELEKKERQENKKIDWTSVK
jgi:hypothetical protein